MEWTKAKNYTIIFLIVLNIILLGFNIYKSMERRISSVRINDLVSLLEQKDITLACSLPRKYSPMAEIEVSGYNYDFLELERVFMTGESNVKRTEEYNSIVFMSDKSRLIIKDSTISYTTAREQPFASDREAREYADSFIASINKSFGNYKFHSESDTENGHILKYYEKAQGRNVFSNFAYFTINGENISLALNYVSIGSEKNDKSLIYASDEAVYSARELILRDSKKPVITNVELGYYSLDSENGYESYAVPFYVIMCSGKEYYVNAYTGECF